MLSGHASGRTGFMLVRRKLVERLRAQGIHDPRVLAAFEDVPRHDLVPEALWGQAYKDTALPIGEGQTISAPGIVATMSAALGLRGTECVLEVGTGSGYQAAILSRLAARVISIERIPALAHAAQAALANLEVRNVEFYLGDGTCGRPEDAPFDAIVVTAGGPEVPRPLLEQLTLGGRLVGPFGPRDAQQLLRIQRTGEASFTQEVLGRCDFVDLVGRNGWLP
jgi:protein-L-isoaspartate(D-aspartate) O-methyltransferase